MIKEWPSYSEYRQALHPWLPKVPSHWLEERAKVTFHEVDERSLEGKEELLSVSHMTGVTPRSQKNVTMFKAANYTGHKLAKPGDIVINTMWAWMGALGESNYTGIVSPAYGVYRSKPGMFVTGYLDYLLRTRSYISEFICRSTGIRSSRLRLYPDKFLCIPLLQPPEEEQQQIVAFLRSQDHQIAKLIRGKQRLIELLNEQKQTIIHHAVTRGITSKVSLTPSGLDWIGDIPSHWKIKRLKYLLNEIDVRSQNGQEQLLKVSQYTGVTPRSLIEGSMSPDTRATSLVGYKCIEENDLVINIMLAWNGSMGVSKQAGIVSPAYCVYRFKKGLNPWFFHHLLKTSTYRGRIKTASTGVIESRLRLYSEDLGCIEAIVPPSEEQDAIINFIELETFDIDQAIDGAEKELKLIHEYRDRLIFDVVTGQIDVRGWQQAADDEGEETYLNMLDEIDSEPEDDDGDNEYK